MSGKKNAYDPKHTVKEVQATISNLGIKKANTRSWQLFLLAILAGLYIGIGSHLFLVAMEQNLGRILAGAVFGVGLVLVVIAGAELFTGNVTMVVGTITGHFSILKMLKNWAVVYAGNFVAAYLFALLVFNSGVFGSPESPSSMGAMAIKVAEAKLSLTFSQAFIRGIICNILVILGIILSFFAKDVISKIFCCILPIMAFVASGFDHCVANMYLIPAGLFAKGVPLTEQTILFKNLIPVTLGNIVGGIFILVVHPNRIRQIIMLLQNKKA